MYKIKNPALFDLIQGGCYCYCCKYPPLPSGNLSIPHMLFAGEKLNKQECSEECSKEENKGEGYYDYAGCFPFKSESIRDFTVVFSDSF